MNINNSISNKLIITKAIFGFLSSFTMIPSKSEMKNIGIANKEKSNKRIIKMNLKTFLFFL